MTGMQRAGRALVVAGCVDVLLSLIAWWQLAVWLTFCGLVCLVTGLGLYVIAGVQAFTEPTTREDPDSWIDR